MTSDLKLGKKLAEGKTKIVYESTDANEVILEFKDDITAGDGLKHDVISGKGYLNCAISSKIFEILENAGVPTHYVKYVPPSYMVVRKVTMLPVEIVCRNIAAGHLLHRFPVKAGEKMEPPLVEFFLKDDEHHDPMINDMHMTYLKLATRDECDRIREITLNVNSAMKEFFDSKGIKLVDFKIEVGRDASGQFLVSDEINGDSCRLWVKAEEGKILDKDVYRKGGSLDEVKNVYINLYKQLIGQEPSF
ncbi:MAG: phosphoribosylaminoimidazolesuccinocarboxamide synthase [Candidatus Helarchaeota archaeon]|nr:phosphoribosylaminoimidazolesuccinocarboxamide synthase [Candidatus Helarchaeota archaeon]